VLQYGIAKGNKGRVINELIRWNKEEALVVVDNVAREPELVNDAILTWMFLFFSFK